MSMHSLKEAEDALQKYVPLVSQYGMDGMSLERMYPLLKAAGNPHTKLRVMHIAGTSGKTSTAYYASALLTYAGQKTGLTVSPHVDSINERVQINSEPLAEMLFCTYIEEFLQIVDTVEVKPSYFELMMIFAFWVFVKENVDYAVVETGMGGLLDGSNVVTSANKVCILTEIGFDHQHVLGHTLPEIAAQKAGIMHKGNVAFSYQQAPEIMTVFNERAQSVGAELIVQDQMKLAHNVPAALTTLPLFQQHNWLLARAAVTYVAQRDGFESTSESQNTSLHIVVPGRMQTYKIGNTEVIMDGAHNAQKMNTFVISFMARYPGTKVPILCAVKKGKDYADVVHALLPIAKEFIFTTFKTSQDVPVESLDPELLKTYCNEHDFQNVRVITDYSKAYSELIKNDGMVVITGSFYLLSQIRSNLFGI